MDCNWSDLLLISAIIKPFIYIVSSVCTVPNARNTRRSTALGEIPLIWYCARYPDSSNPTVDSVCDMQRGNVHFCVPSLTVSQMHGSTTASSSLQNFPKQFQRGISSLERVQVLKMGKVYDDQKTNKKQKQRRNQLWWTTGMDGRKFYAVYCTM